MISLIVAMSENRVIGRNGQLPWHMPADLQRFKETTLGHAVIMGRKTFDSMGKPLPKRTNIVITHDRDWRAEGTLTAHSLEYAIQLAAGNLAGEQEMFVIGGAEVFSQALPIATRVYLTIVHASLDGDTFMPEIPQDEWVVTREERHAADYRHAYDYTFQTLDRC